MSHWFLVQLKPDADAIARRNLERQHFTTFQPLERRNRVKAGKCISESHPFFPGYLFLSYPETSAPRSLVNSTYSAERRVSFAGEPATVPEAVNIQFQASSDLNEVMAISHQLEPGTRVEIASGSIASFIGEIELLNPNCRVMVLLDFIIKQTRMNLPAAHARIAPSSSYLRAAVL